MEASPRMLRWQTLTKTQFDQIDPTRAVTLLTRSPIELLDGEIGPGECHSPIWKLRFLFSNPLIIRLLNRLLGFRNAIA